jgi:DNA ligase-1
MNAIKPMLAANADLSKLQYPVYASPKLDGVRAIVYNNTVYSRSGKPIPNKHVQTLFGHLNGLDGELIVGNPTDEKVFQNTTSGVMSIEGTPDVYFYVFDSIDGSSEFSTRWNLLMLDITVLIPHKVLIVFQKLVENEQELLNYEHECLKAGYEGVIIRNPNAKYKHGRSTVKEGALLKLKRFKDAEAEIVGAECLQVNIGETTKNPLGYAECSSKKENKKDVEALGAFIVKNNEGIEFSVGSGFTEKQRVEFWKDRYKLIGKTIKYKYFEIGVKDKPRFPIFLGFRAKEDTND